jgi:hypothetical protein
MKCIGIWETEGKCQNEVDQSYHPFLCHGCDMIRIAHLDECFKKLMDKKWYQD